MTEDEFDAAKRILGLTANIVGSRYYHSPADTTKSAAILAQCDVRSSLPAGEIARSFIEDFRPSLLVLMGTAGGLGRDGVQLGDVVVASYIDYYEFMKVTPAGVLPRRNAHDHPAEWIWGCWIHPMREEPWADSIDVERPTEKEQRPAVHFGNVLTGEKILANPTYRFQDDVVKMYDKALCVETESYGVARAVYQARSSVHYNPIFVVLRGISDIAQQDSAETERKAWTAYAAAAAAALVKALTDRICTHNVADPLALGA